ncbi:general amino acid permease 1 [Cylindrobasidium torrendii FP15055 ss-10]|uniref:General amino acid permease 1 n=1 Tax=Cylindrobasidium torrendii FP15055 ss-10 TaxID=1314674 RepID=A0A0D7B124_9AGAR|nr:general amino acid permease 1 [Cylindrobasidium torrendii FP15055 ss-10]
MEHGSDIEKQDEKDSVGIAYATPDASAKYHFDEIDLDRMQQGLKQRHVQMIAIAGTIGTGIFLGSGGALSTAGPLGALIAYALVGTVAYASLCSVGEMATWAPVSGSFPHFAARWVDPALGFAVGWNYFYGQGTSVPVEVSAATILIGYWDDNKSHEPIYLAAILIVMCAINVFGVRYFGESEFIFAIIKLSTIIGLIIVGLVIDLGGGPNHERIGFRYWKNPGAINRAGLVENISTDRFLAILSTIVQAAFSFTGMELVAIAASETENPRRNIAKAVRRVFYRIVIFYILGILIIGMLISYDDPSLLNQTGDAAQSPFVIAMNRAGIKVLPHIVNAAVFTSAFSAGSSYLFCASRVLYGLALRGQAPRFLTYCTKNGLPIYAVLISCSFSLLSFMSINSGAETVFNWFVNLTTVGGFIGWFCINLTYVFFRRGMIAQGFDLKSNIYHSNLQPWLSYWGIFWTIVFILVNGYRVFFAWNTSDFLVAYINIPIILTLYLGYKITKRTKIWKPEQMDFVSGIPTIEETEKPIVPPRTILEKVAAFLF